MGDTESSVVSFGTDPWIDVSHPAWAGGADMLGERDSSAAITAAHNYQATLDALGIKSGAPLFIPTGCILVTTAIKNALLAGTIRCFTFAGRVKDTPAGACVAIPSVGGGGGAATTSVVVADIAARNALPVLPTGSFVYVENIRRLFEWDGATYRPIADGDYINVLDYGAHWTLADNSAAFQAAINDSICTTGGTRKAMTLLIPPPPADATVGTGYFFTNAVNMRNTQNMRVVALAGDKQAFGGPPAMVMLANVTNANPIIDGDKEASGLSTFGGNVFERIMFYNPIATPVVGSGCHGWTFKNCLATTFAAAHGMSLQNTFEPEFDHTGFCNAAGTTVGCLGLSGQDATSSDTGGCYEIGLTRCFFSGGPWVEYTYKNAVTNFQVSGYRFEDCIGENGPGDEGLFFRVTRTSTGGGVLSGMEFDSCIAYDPVSGGIGVSWTIVSVVSGVSWVGSDFAYSGCANAGRGQVKCRDGDGSNFGSFDMRGCDLKFVKSDNTLTANAYNMRRFSSNGTLRTGEASNGTLVMNVDPRIDVPRGDVWALQGESYGRFAIGNDGYLMWADGASVAPDMYMHRAAAKTLELSDGFNLRTGFGAGTKIADGTAQKLGFWSAAPIQQPTVAVAAAAFVAGAGTAVNDASTFDGYTVKQLVKALRNMGLLA